jgi:hypothetical protein
MRHHARQRRPAAAVFGRIATRRRLLLGIAAELTLLRVAAELTLLRVAAELTLLRVAAELTLLRVAAELTLLRVAAELTLLRRLAAGLCGRCHLRRARADEHGVMVRHHERAVVLAVEGRESVIGGDTSHS